MEISKIKMLFYVIRWQSSIDQIWTGRTNDSIESIIKKGYAVVYPARNHDGSVLKDTEPDYIPLHQIFSITVI